MKNPCPCTSQKPYDECCAPFHKGELPKTALQLMRSRFSAYALHLAPYIIATTHKANPNYQKNMNKWTQEILLFSQTTTFEKLDILEVDEGDIHSSVTFTAHLTNDHKNISFTEKSLFEKVAGKWLYKEGIFRH